jgi:prepilin-type N-terminal cleavage/methylation domain-containing protein
MIHHKLAFFERNTGRDLMNHAKPKESGFSLIELTLATAIFSMGLGGLSLMLLTAVMGTAEAGHQTVASSKATSLAELIVLNSGSSGHYVNPLPPSGISCIDGGVGGRGLVCRDSTPNDGHAADDRCDGNGGLVVKVFWQEMRHINDDDAGLRRLVTRLPF